MANRQARRAVRKATARFLPHNVTVPAQPKLHRGLLPRTRDLKQWLAFIGGVYGGGQ